MLNDLIVKRQCLSRLLTINYYGGNDNYIKTRMKFFWDKIKQIFKLKKCQKKMNHVSLCH